MNVLLPWTIDDAWYVRYKYPKHATYNYSNIHMERVAWVAPNIPSQKWRCFGNKLCGLYLFDEVYKFSDTKEEAFRMIDEALEKSGWKLLDKNDKLMLLI